MTGEVVVQVAAATVNPTDLMMLAGQQAALMKELSPPYIAGMEFAGRVHQLGTDVGDLKVGQMVMGIVNPRRPEGGAHAQFLRVPAASLAPVPQALDSALAATIPMNGLTAWMCLEALALRAGAVVLVTGAAGAVGGYVVQLARHAGLHVVADAKEADRPLVLSLGAHDVVPRGEGMVDAVRALHPGGVDGAVDGALLGDAAAALVRNGGPMALLRSSQTVTDDRLRYSRIGVLQQATNTDALHWLAALVHDGTLVPRLSARLPLARAAEAYTLVQQGGLRGRVVLELQ
jgi:NADPH:quinone reductase-like Zn-dependent oxidoreductase